MGGNEIAIKISGSSEQSENTVPTTAQPKTPPCNSPDMPQMISLGPLHYGNRDFATYEVFKRGFLSQVFPHRARGVQSDHNLRSRLGRFPTLVDDMIKGNPAIIGRVRNWYPLPDDKKYTDEELGELMVRDGLVLLLFLREISRTTELSFPSTPDYNVARFFLTSLRASGVQRDVMKLENRIPIFVLKRIHKWETDTWQEMITDYLNPRSSKRLMLQDLSLQWEAGAYEDPISNLQNVWHTLSPFYYKRAPHNSQVSPVKEDWHLLRFVYENIVRPSSQSSSESSEKNVARSWLSRLPNFPEICQKVVNCLTSLFTIRFWDLPREKNIRAKTLYDKGVKFAALEDPYLEKISFDSTSCTYKLPAIEMNDRTEAVMRSLMAFEVNGSEKHDEVNGPKKPGPLMRYVNLMNRLIHEAADVDVLRKGDVIISHSCTNEDVLYIWKGIKSEGDQAAVKCEPMDEYIAGVERFSGSRFRRFRLRIIFRVICRDFKKRYFSSPWIAISLIAACILFVIAVMQTVLAWVQVRLQIESMTSPASSS